MESTALELTEKVEIMTRNKNFDESQLKKRRLIRILILISIIILVVFIIFIIYFCLRSDDDDNNEEKKEKDLCEKGENDKCLSCQKNTNYCESCNNFFKLENGKCKFIYSFEAIYKINQSNDQDKVKLFNVESLLDNYEINKIQINNEYFDIKEY